MCHNYEVVVRCHIVPESLVYMSWIDLCAIGLYVCVLDVVIVVVFVVVLDFNVVVVVVVVLDVVHGNRSSIVIVCRVCFLPNRFWNNPKHGAAVKHKVSSNYGI